MTSAKFVLQLRLQYAMLFKEPKSSSAKSSGSINGEKLTRSWFLPVCVQQIHGAWHDLALELFESSCFALFLFYFTIGTFPFIRFVDPRATAGIYIFFSNAPGSTTDQQMISRIIFCANNYCLPGNCCNDVLLNLDNSFLKAIVSPSSNSR